MSNTKFNITLSYGVFDDDLCWEAKVYGTEIVLYSTDTTQLLLDISKEIQEKYPLHVNIPSATLNDICFFNISADEELDLIRKTYKFS